MTPATRDRLNGWKWPLIVALATVLFSVMGWTWVSMAGRVDRIEAEHIAIEGKVSALDAQHQMFQAWLKRLDEKLDAALARP